MFIFQTNQEAQRNNFISESTIDSSAHSNYTVAQAEEIRKKLNFLHSKNVLLTVSVPGKFAASTLLTTIIHVEKTHILLEGFQNERFNKDLLNQNNLIAKANHEGIAINFILSELSANYTNGIFALKAAMPKSLEWVQRRNARRVKVPINFPVKIQPKNQSEFLNVLDISVTGLSYIDQSENSDLSVIGKLHQDCDIILPDKSIQSACFEIVSNVTVPYKFNRQICRIGCEIKQASYRLDTALQRLINQIDFYYQ